ncbi:shikimate dehydrogenase [Candidatus Woesearchaeota archaeon]|nr:shikimate dehydrogenase [Candidatus Woesearchaeota archaeon]
MLAAVITELKDIPKAKDADLIELRLDYIKGLNNTKLKSLIENCKKPVIVTNRKKGEGGLFNGSEAKRIEILKNAIKFGAGYADIEYSSGKESIRNLIQNKRKTKIIVSYHNFKETPANIKKIYGNIKKLNPDLIKIATNARSVTDNFRVFGLIGKANKEKRKIIAFCMGGYGKFSRILSIILGSQVTYASTGKGKESAGGQLTMNEMVEHYRIKKINKNTKIVGLIGNPVEHSWSHIMHNAAFDRLDINAVYLKFQADKLKEFIEHMKNLDIIGFSVTIPHKVEVMRYLDEIDKQAKGISAVNTIVVKNGRLIGYNTDCPGAIKSLKRITELKGKNAVVLGAGGAARAIIYGLMENKSNVKILNRTAEKAKLLADYFKCDYGSLDDIKKTDYDILINTTPAGMHPHIGGSPVPPDCIKNGAVVFDMVFNPYKTKLLVEAEKRNCRIIAGFEMLIHGALLQFKLWTGKEAPERLMRLKVMEFLKNAGH